MAYEAPRLVEVGNLADITLGSPNQRFYNDSNSWWDIMGPVPGSR